MIKRKIIALLSVVVLLLFGHYAVAGTAYDEYKATIAKAEKVVDEYTQKNSELQAYLDAVESGSQEKWETARKAPAVMDAIRMHKDVPEKDAVKSAMETNQSMIDINQNKIDVSEHKMDVYYHAYILQDLDAVNAILANGNRTVPEDTSGNIYYAWPYTEIPEGLLTDNSILGQNRGNVYLAPATVSEKVKDSIYLVDIYGTTAKAKFETGSVSIGENVNIYFTAFMMESDALAYIVVGSDESTIDSYHALRTQEE